MKLLVVSHAGVLDVNRAIFQELASCARGLELVMIVPSHWKGDLIADLRYEPSRADRSIRVIPLPVQLSGNGSLFFFARSLRRALGDWEPDAVFVDEEPWSLACKQVFSAFKKVPASFFTKQNLRKTLPLPFEWLEDTIFAQSASAFSVASEVSEVLRWKGYSKTIHELPHSFDPLCFHARNAEERLARRTELGIPPEARIVSYFGRLTPEKGIDELLEAMHALDAPKAHFLFVGNGPKQAKIRDAIAAMPLRRATLVPAIPHHRVGATLAISDILVLPSRTEKNWKEQFGRILVEAWACGSAVVGSDSGEIPRLIARSGGGLSFRERDATALRNTLAELLSDSAALERFRRNGHAYAHANLTHRKVAETLARQLGTELKEAGSSRYRESPRDANPL